jgi:uncharacterized protein with ParB-like and HNH nuclease domain
MKTHNFKTDNVLYSEIIKISSKQLIPSLQRPYTWDKKHINKLWEDLIDNESPYFIGTVVLVAGEGSASRDEVIDGQQRLTTVSLFLVALRNYIIKNQSNTSKYLDDIRNLLLEPQFDGDPIARLEFIDKNSNAIYKELLNSEGCEISRRNPIDAERKFIDNYNEIEKIITTSIKDIKITSEEIFDKIKSLEFVVIQCATKTSGYKLFEGLNATAVPLTGVDLIKNSLFMKVSLNPTLLSKTEEDWRELEDKFSGSSRRMFQSFIRHQWLSSVGYVNHSGLFKEFENSYLKGGSDKQVLSYVKELLADADIYLALRNVDIDSLDKLTQVRNEKAEVRELLEFLSYLNVDQVYPILLYMYKNNIKSFKKYLIKLVSFQFLFKHLPGSPSIVEKYFAQFCRNDIGAENLFKSLEKLCTKQEDVFLESFLSKTKYIKGKSGDVQFILQRFLYSDDNVKSHRKPTIEHIIPQTPPEKQRDLLFEQFGGAVKFRSVIHQIGNLTILEKDANGNYDNKIFAEKKVLFLKDPFKENQKIKDFYFESRPKEAIDVRGEYIAKKIYSIFIKSLSSGKLD